MPTSASPRHSAVEHLSPSPVAPSQRRLDARTTARRSKREPAPRGSSTLLGAAALRAAPGMLRAAPRVLRAVMEELPREGEGASCT
jgi:hypothetical protein